MTREARSTFQAKFGARMLKTKADGSYARMHETRSESVQSKEEAGDDGKQQFFLGGGTIKVAKHLLQEEGHSQVQGQEPIPQQQPFYSRPSHLHRAGQVIASTPQRIPPVQSIHPFPGQPTPSSYPQAVQPSYPQAVQPSHPSPPFQPSQPTPVAYSGQIPLEPYSTSMYTYQNPASEYSGPYSGEPIYQTPQQELYSQYARPGLSDLEHALNGDPHAMSHNNNKFHGQSQQHIGSREGEGDEDHDEETKDSVGGGGSYAKQFRRTETTREPSGRKKKGVKNRAPSPPQSYEEDTEDSAEKKLTKEEMNEKLIRSERDQLFYSKKRRPVDFKPCTVQEYLKEKPKEYYELGKLKADLDSDELKEKREKQQRMKEYGAKLRVINAQPTTQDRSQRRMYTGRQGGIQAQEAVRRERKAQSARQRGIEFAKSVPRPRVRSSHAAMGRQEPDNDAQRHGNSMTELDRLALNHEKARQEIEKIRHEFGML